MRTFLFVAQIRRVPPAVAVLRVDPDLDHPVAYLALYTPPTCTSFFFMASLLVLLDGVAAIVRLRKPPRSDAPAGRFGYAVRSSIRSQMAASWFVVRQTVVVLPQPPRGVAVMPRLGPLDHLGSLPVLGAVRQAIGPCCLVSISCPCFRLVTGIRPPLKARLGP